MRRIANVIGIVLVVAALGVGAYLKWWNIAGAGKLGESCSTRAGCRTFWCLAHERAGSAEQPSSGYCTDKCETDSDCSGADGMKCVVPSAAALDDLAKYGRPDKLCMRAR